MAVRVTLCVFVFCTGRPSWATYNFQFIPLPLAYYELNPFFMKSPTVFVYRLRLTRSPVCRRIKTSTMFEIRCKALISVKVLIVCDVWLESGAQSDALLQVRRVTGTYGKEGFRKREG
jgi:hypothetical protein